MGTSSVMIFVRMNDVPHNTVVRTNNNMAMILFFDDDMEYLLSTIFL
jgi:hypothetical protein